MSIKETVKFVANSNTALTVGSIVALVSAGIAANKNKPEVAAVMLGLSTTMNVREIYVRHRDGAKAIQDILCKSNDISKMDVPTEFVKTMQKNKS